MPLLSLSPFQGRGRKGFLSFPSFQTAIFSILQYTANVPELGSQVLTFVAIFLPLSSLWAAASINHKADPSSGRRCGGGGGGGGGDGGGGSGAGSGFGGGGRSGGIGIFGIFTRSSDDHHTTDTTTDTTTNKNAGAINASGTSKRKTKRGKRGRGHLRFMGIGQSVFSSRAGTADNTGNDAGTGTGTGIISSTGSDGSDGSDGGVGVGVGIEGIEKEKEKY